MNKSKGFTIIELIVVIAIIAVLAAIVLVNVTQYINKGKNAALKGNLTGLTTSAAVYFDTTPACTGALFVTPGTVPAVGNVSAAVLSIGSALTTFGSAATQDWCACAMELPTGATGTVFCVDNTGAKKETAATTCAAQCTAPATGKCL
jgi:prepilin-type N-terminal cleavage/methylation domain-containing protein